MFDQRGDLLAALPGKIRATLARLLGWESAAMHDLSRDSPVILRIARMKADYARPGLFGVYYFNTRLLS